MTNKEAIKVLENHISPYDNCKADNEANQAISLAIKALKERPQVELANKVWRLYKKYQPHLATRSIVLMD